MKSAPSRILVCLGFSLLCLTTATAESSLLTGCSSFQFGAPAPCFVNDVEILPGIHISESGIVRNVDSPSGCQEKCAALGECQYFTFRTDKTSGVKTCHLKPAPSDQSAPIMVVRKYGSNSKFSYVSGPKICGRICTEGVEVAVGCGGSSPSSCGLLQDSVFDSTCANNSNGNCGKRGYKCCRDCSKEGACCNTRITGWVLIGGQDFASKWSGIFSADHCHTLCVKTAQCTHWNYVASSSTAFLGGACYLKTYIPANRPVLVEAPNYVTSVVGAVDCSRDYGIKVPNSTPPPSDVTGETIEGTCFVKNVDIVGGTLYKQWGIPTAAACQELCQRWPGCVSFIFTAVDSQCQLKYTKYGIAAHGEDDLIFGPRDCPDAQPAPSVDGCITPDSDIDIETAQEVHSFFAAECGSKCMWYSENDCQGWSFFNERCYIKRSATPQVAKLGAASGVRGCRWPEYGRRLSIAHDVPVGCAHENKEYKGSDLESFEVENFEECSQKCLERPDCKAISYYAVDQICRIKWGGELVDRIGVTSMPRECPCVNDQCPAIHSLAVPSVPGLSLQSLGKPSEWVVKGDIVNFSAPSTWQRMAIIVLSDEDCFISDLVTSKNCWERHAQYLPLHIRVQIVGVANGGHFKGWSSIAWDKKTVDSSTQDGHIELFNQEMIIVKEDKPNSDHGVYIQPIAGSSLPLPNDLTTPFDFSEGEYYARLQSISTPAPISFHIVFCLTGSDYPVSEVCTVPLVAPPYNI